MTNIFTKRSLRTLILAGAAVLAVAAAALAYYLLAPSGYLSLDVNPSIEIRTNRLDQVVSVTGANEDGKALLEGYRLTDRDLDDVIEDLVDRMILQGYLGDGKTNDVLITVDDDTVSAKTLDRVNAKVEDYVAYRNLTANVLSQKIDVSDDLLETASQHHVSAGKMAVIDRLVQQDSSLSPEDFADIRISDLVSYAKEKNISLELLEDRLDDLADRSRDNKTLEQLEDKLDDADDRYDDDLDDRYDDDLDDRYDDDLDDRYDDDLDDRYDDDLDDRYDDDLDDRYDDDFDDRYDDDLDDRYDDDDRDDWDDDDDRDDWDDDDDRDDWDDDDDRDDWDDDDDRDDWDDDDDRDDWDDDDDRDDWDDDDDRDDWDDDDDSDDWDDRDD